MYTVFRAGIRTAGLAGMILVGACAVPVTPVETENDVPEACTPASSAEPLLGNWLSVRSQKGVAGELRTLFTLQADGTMTYAEQLKRKGQPSQGLSEAGCWHRDGSELTLQTRESNGSAVDSQDPIYTNRYQIRAVDDAALRLADEQGRQINAKRMSPGYRLPF